MEHDFVNLEILKVTKLLVFFFINVVELGSELVLDGLNEAEFLRVRESGGEDGEEEEEGGGEEKRGE